MRKGNFMQGLFLQKIFSPFLRHYCRHSSGMQAVNLFIIRGIPTRKVSLFRDKQNVTMNIKVAPDKRCNRRAIRSAVIIHEDCTIYISN